jgi:hypothetical protein
MRISIAAVIVAASLAGCRSDGQATSVLDQAPIDRVLLNGDYRTISSCAYERLDKAAGNGIKKVDLDGSTRLALESGAFVIGNCCSGQLEKTRLGWISLSYRRCGGLTPWALAKLCRRSKPAPREAMALI